MRAGLAEGAGVVALGFEADDPTGYGRLVERDGALVAIREQKDASAAERAIRAATPARCRHRGRALTLEAVRDDNAAVNSTSPISSRSLRAGYRARGALVADDEEVMGVNDRVQLAVAEAAMQDGCAAGR